MKIFIVHLCVPCPPTTSIIIIIIVVIVNLASTAGVAAWPNIFSLETF